MQQYQRDLNKDLSVNEFWNEYGYSGGHAHYPSNDAKFLKIRLQRIKPLMQCVSCGQWRQLRYHPKQINHPPNPDTWTCEMNTDNSFLSCLKSEEFDTIPLGEYKAAPLRQSNRFTTKAASTAEAAARTDDSNDTKSTRSATSKNNKSSSDLCREWKIVNIEYTYKSDDFAKLVTYKLFDQHIRPHLLKKNPKLVMYQQLIILTAKWREFNELKEK